MNIKHLYLEEVSILGDHIFIYFRGGYKFFGDSNALSA